MKRRLLPIFIVLGIGFGILFYFIGRHIVREILADAEVTFGPLLGTSLSIVVPLLVLILISGLSISLVSKLEIHKM